MPQKIILEDGTEREIPTEEEYKILTEESAKYKETSSLIGELQKTVGVKEGENVIDAIKELAEDPNNRNWRATRETIKSLKTALKEKGIETDDNGTIVTQPVGIKPEDVNQIVQSELAKAKRETALSQFTTQERQQIEPLLERAMSLGGTMEENLELVTAKLFPGKVISDSRKIFGMTTGGRGPIQAPVNNGGITEQATEIGNSLGIPKTELEKGGRITNI